MDNLLDATQAPFVTNQYGQYTVAARALGTVRGVRVYHQAVRAVHGGSTRPGHGEWGLGYIYVQAVRAVHSSRTALPHSLAEAFGEVGGGNGGVSGSQYLPGGPASGNGGRGEGPLGYELGPPACLPVSLFLSAPPLSPPLSSSWIPSPAASTPSRCCHCRCH